MEKKQEQEKLEPVTPPFEAVEFSPDEVATIALMFIYGLHGLMKQALKSQRYRIDLKMYQVIRVRKKVEAR